MDYGVNNKGVSESHFYMWRALFALAHADDRVDDREVRLMAEILEDVDFSDAQRTILNNDMHEAKDVEEMFLRVTDGGDQSQFFRYAREMVWADGDFGEEERALMLHLQKIHVRDMNLDELVGQVQMQFEDDDEITKPKKKRLHKKRRVTDDDFLEDYKSFTFKDFFSTLKSRLAG